MNVTRIHLDIISHSLGNGGWFATDEGSKDFNCCEELVENGCMTRRDSPFGNEWVYYVTRAGKNLKMEKEE